MQFKSCIKRKPNYGSHHYVQGNCMISGNLRNIGAEPSGKWARRVARVYTGSALVGLILD
jgi:hypothetical protein